MYNRLPELLPAHHAAITTDVVIEPTLAGTARELLVRTGFAGKSLLLVCDTATYEVLGERILKELSYFETELLTLTGEPVADTETVALLRARHYDAIIGVGSGTISDLCKYASFLEAKPYAIFPTAPSMNGYMSANASITEHGHKKTLPAHLPKGVFCDLNIISEAPTRLILSGLGDSICRSTAQADWLLSHLLLGTFYTPLPFDLLKPYEQDLFSQSDKLVSGNLQAIDLLMKTLLVSGIGMVIAGGSYPASQGEHLIAHTMQMRYSGMLPKTYHGEEIGVATLTMAKIQQEILGQKLHLRKRQPWGKNITAYFGASMAQSVMEASHPKYLLRDRYDEINARLETDDQKIRDAISKVILPPSQLRDVLLLAGAPTSPSDLGWSERDYDLAVFHARFIRDRFTFLDLL